MALQETDRQETGLHSQQDEGLEMTFLERTILRKGVFPQTQKSQFIL